MEQTLNRIAAALESMAASLQDIATYQQGQLTLDLQSVSDSELEERIATPDEILEAVSTPTPLPESAAGLFDDLEEEPPIKPKPEQPVPRERLVEALNSVAEKRGVPAAKDLLQRVGGVTRLDQLPQEKARELLVACGAA